MVHGGTARRAAEASGESEKSAAKAAKDKPGGDKKKKKNGDGKKEKSRSRSRGRPGARVGADDSGQERKRTYQGRLDADSAKELIKQASTKVCPAFTGGCCNLGGTCRLKHPAPTDSNTCKWCGAKGCKADFHKIFDGNATNYVRFVDGQHMRDNSKIYASYENANRWPKKFCKDQYKFSHPF